MADEEEREQDSEEEGSTPAAGEYQPTAASGLGKIIRILIYAALGVAGVLLMSIIAYYVAMFAASRQYKEVASIAVVKPPPPMEAFELTEDFKVNTADTGETHFIKLRLSFGFEPGNAQLAVEIAQRKPQLRNIINLILAGKKKENLATVQDQLDLREEIKASVNHILSEGKIAEVYFNEFIVQ
ncbi:MAG: flagellar basal body-associated FliL family protein [Spirochaetia bacterium]|nr:flagellar basal body-associated FliL family protein [Spirochaetia bacterium]